MRAHSPGCTQLDTLYICHTYLQGGAEKEPVNYKQNKKLQGIPPFPEVNVLLPLVDATGLGELSWPQ